MNRKVKWIIAGVCIVILAALVFYYTTQGIEVEVIKAARGEIKQYVEDIAEVKCRNIQTVYIEGQGKVNDIKVDTGKSVKEGDVLVVLDKTELELQLEGALAKINAAKAELKGTEIINYANKIEMGEIAVGQAEIAFESAARDFRNAKDLYSSGALSKAEYEKIKEAYEVAKSNLDSARLELEELKKGTPGYVREGYQAQLKQAVVNKKSIEERLKKQDVRAPISGVVIDKLIQKSAVAVPGTPAFVIGDVNDLELEANILANDAVKISVGNKVEISGRILKDKVIKGKVVKIAPGAKDIVSSLGVNQKRVPVTIELLENSELLKPGYKVDIKIITLVRDNTIKVPDSSVFEYKGEDYVFVVENGKTKLRRIKKGIESWDSVEILDGIKEGEFVLTKPDNNIEEGLRVRAVYEKS